MVKNFVLRRYDRSKLIQICTLFFLWSAGLVAGVCLTAVFPAADDLSLDAVIAVAPSWHGLLIVAGAPVVLCAVGTQSGVYPILCFAVLIESVCRGFCGFWVYRLCGSGAWLLRMLFQCSSVVGAVLMWWIIFRHYIYGKSTFHKDLRIAAIVLFLLITVDLLLVSPFLICLSMYF